LIGRIKESGVSFRGGSPKFSCTILLILLAAAYCAAPARGEGFQPVNPDELKISNEPEAPGATAVILYRQVDRDDSGHTAHENDYIRIKILKEEGRKYADVEIPFFKESGNNIVNIHARTIRPDGSLAEFQGKAFDKSIVKAKGLSIWPRPSPFPTFKWAA
jgi:hypothetical protein